MDQNVPIGTRLGVEDLRGLETILEDVTMDDETEDDGCLCEDGFSCGCCCPSCCMCEATK